MAGFNRPIILDQGIQRPASAGTQGLGVNFGGGNSTVVASTLTASLISAGALWLGTGASLVTDTAANYLLAYPEMAVGDSIALLVFNASAGVITPTAGTGVTVSGTLPATSLHLCMLYKNSATTFLAIFW